MAHGKRYENALKLVDRERHYPLADAVALVKQMATTKFDETVELHFRLGIDPRHSDQQVRSTVLLPNGLGKTVRVLVFAEGRHTSMRDDNVLSGEIYEIRLITPQEDLLVDYFEERTVEDFPSIFNPYAARRRNAADEAPPTHKAFIEKAMGEARR